MTYFEMLEIYDFHGKLLASCTSNEAAEAARRLLMGPDRLAVVSVDKKAGIITISEAK